MWWSGIFWPGPSFDDSRAEAGDGRGFEPKAVDCPAMRSFGHQPVGALLSAFGRKCGKPGADAADGRDLYGLPVLWRAPDEASFAPAGPQGGAPPRRPVDAENGPGGDLPEAQHQQAEQGKQDLPVSSQGLGDHKAQSEPALAKARVWCTDIILGSSPRTGSISRWPRASCIWRR